MFHKAVNRRRVRNGISGMEVGGEWVDDPQKVKRAVFEHYKEHFRKRSSIRVEMREIG